MASRYYAALLPALAAFGQVQGVRFVGRVNPETRELTWPSTGVSFTFEGTSASIGLDSVTGANSVALTVDGGEPTVIANVEGTSISTPGGLAQGNHTVVLRKRSEAFFGTITVGDVTTDGTLGEDVTPTRRVEIIGDSISVGYGMDGVNPCTNTAALEDNPNTYGALAAEALGADYSVVAWSGKGLVRNAPGDNQPVLLPNLYSRYGADDADGSYPFPAETAPDAIVINLGTNDFNYLGARAPLDAAAFSDAMVAFVRSIQTRYPDAQFFLVTSPMLSDNFPTEADAQKTTQTEALTAAISQLDGARVHLVDWPTQGADVGCDFHPNVATHAAGAEVLADAIGSVLGW